MRQRRWQHLRLAFSAGRGRGAQVDARLLDELRDRRDPSPGACAIGAEIARAAVGGAVEEGADEHFGLDTQAEWSKAAGVIFRNAAECCLAKARGGCRPLDELRNRRDPSPGARAISAEMASAGGRAGRSPASPPLDVR
jgi:hypothetical protein